MTDTIVAPASAQGPAGVGVIRLSGPDVRRIAENILGNLPIPRYATYADFKNIDKGIVLFFPKPHSFTGEDVLELQGHGGYVVMDLIIQEILTLGARLARPGEFSERAFLNNKMDLSQAEAIADLIDAGSIQAARAAKVSLEGVFSDKINFLTEKIITLRVYIEAEIDFTEEEIDFLSHEKIYQAIQDLIQILQSIQQSAKQGVLLRDGMVIALAGKPNAGKSSLLNQLTGRDSAIVTAIPGTTRDILREHIQLDGLPVQVIDTAGLRDSDDVIEQEGVRRARDVIAKADVVLYLKDITENSENSDNTDSDYLEYLNHPSARIIMVYNKIDVNNKINNLKNNQINHDYSTAYISAKTGQGLSELKDKLKNIMGFSGNTETVFSARRRHMDSLKKTEDILVSILENNKCISPELLAEDLRMAQKYLGEITGEFTTDDLLGKIFSSFCVGK